MMVSPRGNIYVVTTGPNPAFYRPAQVPVNGGVVALRRVASAPEGVTDGTFLSDGQHLAVRTPIGVHLYDAFTFQRVALGPTPDQVPGDALAESLDGGRLMVGYGGATPRVSVMDYPTGMVSSSPQPSVTPVATTSSSPSQSPSSTSTEPTPDSTSAPATTPPSRASGARGTLAAIGIAALVALLAAATTLVGRRR